jgi:hypothetical protein
MYDAKQGVRVVGHTRFKIQKGLEIQNCGMSSARWYNFSFSSTRCGTIASTSTNFTPTYRQTRAVANQTNHDQADNKTPNTGGLLLPFSSISDLRPARENTRPANIHSSAPASNQHQPPATVTRVLVSAASSVLYLQDLGTRARQQWTPLGSLFPCLFESSIDRIAPNR